MRLKSTISLFIFFFITIHLHAQQTVLGSIVHDGVERNYRLHLPTDYSSDQSLPLVFNLHGYTSDAFQQELYSGMNAVADTANFLVCYPDGIGNAWNVGWAFGSSADDVGFISGLIDHFIADYNINPERVYSCGMSNGGFMSYRLACELNERVAAIASVTGSFAPQYVSNCQPEKPVPVLEIHGTADPVVSYTGTLDVSIPIDSVIQFWVENNNCLLTPDTTAIPNTSLLDLCTAERIDYLDCEAETQVSLIKINNGGHTWPGASIIVGTTNQDFEASETIWHFFNQYELDIPTSAEDLALVEEKTNIFPNPASDVLHVDFEKDNIEFTYEIFSSNGQTFRSGHFHNKTNTIDVSGLNPGVFIISILGKGTSEQYLFVKM